jgi:hypothetical protein
MPLLPADTEDVVLETSPELDPRRLNDQNSAGPLSRPTLAQAAHAERKRKRTKLPYTSNDKSPSSRPRRSKAAQLSPPLTLNSSRNASKDTATDREKEAEVVASPNEKLFQSVEGTRITRSRKGLITKRKPKRPVVCPV